MARAQLALEKSIKAILARHGANGRPLSLRQAERLTGLSPATIGELAKGNARTAETVRRFAEGMGEEPSILLILAGFEPSLLSPTPPSTPEEQCDLFALTGDERAVITNFENALAQLPPGRERTLFVQGIARDTELIQSLTAQKSEQ